MPKGRGVALPLAWRRGLGASLGGRQCRDTGSWAALRVPLHPSTGRGKVGASSAALGGRGVPSRALPGFPVPAERGPPSFIPMSLVCEPAGCCGGPTSGRLTKSPHKSVGEDGMAGCGWASNGCPEAAATAASSLKRGYRVFQSAGLAAGSPVKPSGESA